MCQALGQSSRCADISERMGAGRVFGALYMGSLEQSLALSPFEAQVLPQVMGEDTGRSLRRTLWTSGCAHGCVQSRRFAEEVYLR